MGGAVTTDQPRTGLLIRILPDRSRDGRPSRPGDPISDISLEDRVLPSKDPPRRRGDAISSNANPDIRSHLDCGPPLLLQGWPARVLPVHSAPDPFPVQWEGNGASPRLSTQDLGRARLIQAGSTQVRARRT